MNEVFEEALRHSRRKTILKDIIKDISLKDYKNKTFDEIFKAMSNFKKYGDIGPLTIYDLSSGICRYHGILIDKVYIVGKGPIRAVKLLGLKCSKNKELSLKYVEIKEVIEIFKKKSFILPDTLSASVNGDDLESFICKWQKQF